MIWCNSDNKTRVDFEVAVAKAWEPLATAFENNVLYIYNLLRALGSTPASHSPTDVANAIQAINDSIYAKLQSLGQTPSSKQVADLNAKIQALTEVSWYYSISGDSIGGARYDVTNVAELSLTYWNGGAMDKITAGYCDASGNLISVEHKNAIGNFTIPSGIKSVYFVLVALSSSPTPVIRFKYQTKALR